MSTEKSSEVFDGSSCFQGNYRILLWIILPVYLIHKLQQFFGFNRGGFALGYSA